MAKEPKNFLGIMVSSTFTDLEAHRDGVMDAISRLGFKPVVMEHSGATPADVITESLNMVADCAAYVLIISHKYGQIPQDSSNPEGLSITELEFNQSVALSRPRLLFVMSDNHLTTKAQVETDPAKQAKLEAFKARAKLVDPDNPDSDLACVYEEFSSPDDLATKAAVAIARLIERLSKLTPTLVPQDPVLPDPELPPIPRPEAPALRAIPSYGASQKFVGRRAELETLDDWASPNDANPILLFEAIGGAGKSMLTWQWLNSLDENAAGTWAGRFWYSFYEQGATLADFCREALSYLTGYPVEVFQRLRRPELAERLIAALNTRRWLLVLDGVERILVGYQRLDAPQLRDEEADVIVDPIAKRDPCLCIRPEDDDLLRRFSQVSGSKLLVSSRLTPAVFINRSGTAILGVRRELLKGLRPGDAVELFRACGVEGPAKDMQDFLQVNCDGHPLTVAALAGLVNAYPPDHGNFVKWRDDPRHGGALNLADCDLRQKRNHILDAAIAALEPKTRELLQGLSILRGGADYDLLLAINPFLTAKPEVVEEPEHPEALFGGDWLELGGDWCQRQLEIYGHAVEAYQTYLTEYAAWRNSPEVTFSRDNLDQALRDLERRGLLQFDRPTHRYDLHPVVRGVASGRMQAEDVDTSGARVIDYCQAKSPKHWDDARTLSDVELGLQTLSALLRMRRFDQAFDVWVGSLSEALLFNLEAREQYLALMRGFFPDGFNTPPRLSEIYKQTYIITDFAIGLGPYDSGRALELFEWALELDLTNRQPLKIAADISNIAADRSLPVRRRLTELALALALATTETDRMFVCTLKLSIIMAITGRFDELESKFADLDGWGPPSTSGQYRSGDREWVESYAAYYSGILTEAALRASEDTALTGRNRYCQRQLATLRGRWLIDQGQPQAAIAPLQTAIAMARDVGLEDETAEAALALARQRDGDSDSESHLSRWETFGGAAALYIAWLWAERGEHERAVTAALRAFRDAHDPGEPYVHRWNADRARALLVELGEPVPEIAPYDPATDTHYPWEADVLAFIAELEAEKAAKESANTETDEN